MKKYILAIIALGFAFSLHGQERELSEGYKIVRSNLGTSGSSNRVVTNSGTYSVSQSVGQSSVIGTYSKKGYHLVQGYQQPLHKIKIVETALSNDLLAKIYPNPFEEIISMAFSEPVENTISVLVFDVGGKLVYSKEFSKAQRIQLNLEALSAGHYLLKASSNNKFFEAKLIKK